MYCTYCGTQNPDDYRFCSSCGKPRASSNRATQENSSPSNSSSHAIDTGYIRKLLLSLAIKIQKGEIDQPFKAMSPDDISKISALVLITKEQVDELVKANQFPPQELRLCQDNPLIYIDYLGLLMFVATPIKARILIQGAFWFKSTLLYYSQLENLVNKKDWQSYDDMTADYLDDARTTESNICLMRALVKAAHAKLMRGDRRTCREYLSEFDRILPTMLQEIPDYPFFEDEPTLLGNLIRSCQLEAIDLRAKL